MEKLRILDESPVLVDVAGHLRPVIDFLIEQGNAPVTGKFTLREESGVRTFLFKYPIDTDLLNKHFELPKTIYAGYDTLCKGGVLYDWVFSLRICNAS